MKQKKMVKRENFNYPPVTVATLSITTHEKKERAMQLRYRKVTRNPEGNRVTQSAVTRHFLNFGMMKKKGEKKEKRGMNFHARSRDLAPRSALQ